MDELAKLITCDTGLAADSPIKPTGIPASVRHQVSLAELKDQVQQGEQRLQQRFAAFEQNFAVFHDRVLTDLDNMPDATSAKVTSVLEERSATELQTVTPAGLKGILETALEKHSSAWQAVQEKHLSQLFVHRPPQNNALQASQEPPAVVEPDLDGYLWEDGSHHPLPEDFSLPGGPPHFVWQLYCRGLPDKQIPPLRFVRQADCGIVNTRKRLKDLKGTFAPALEKILADLGMWHGDWVDSAETLPSAELVQEMLDKALPKLELPTLTKKRKRPCKPTYQTAWITIVDKLRMVANQPEPIDDNSP